VATKCCRTTVDFRFVVVVYDDTQRQSMNPLSSLA